MIGAGLARNLKLAVGGKLTMLGGARDGSIAADVLTVTGIFATGAPEIDRQVIEMPLTRFQSDFALGSQRQSSSPWRAAIWPRSRPACRRSARLRRRTDWWCATGPNSSRRCMT